MIEIQWLAANLDEAKTISKLLVQQKLIACANLIPNVTSLYIWEDKLEESQEVLCLFKTCQDNYLAIEKTILEHSSYSIPAIITLPTDGYAPYLYWVHQQTKI